MKHFLAAVLLYVTSFFHLLVAFTSIFRFFSYTACSDPGIAFAPKAAYNSSDEDNNAGISLVDAVHHHVSNLGTTSGGEVGGDGEREKFHIPAGGRNHSSGSSNGDHLNETHNNGFVAPAGEEEGMQGDIEDGLNHINSQHTASVGPQTALIDVPPSSGSSSGMSNRITISGGNRIRIGAAGSGGGSMLNHSTSVGNAGAGTSGSSGGGLGGLSLQPRLPPPPLIECGRCQIDR